MTQICVFMVERKILQVEHFTKINLIKSNKINKKIKSHTKTYQFY
jgi:hypothetical protein